MLFRETEPAVYVYHQMFDYARPDVHAARVHGPLPAGAVRRREHLPARRNHVRPEAGPAAAHPGLQGKPEPDFRPVSRSRRAQVQELLEAAVAGKPAARGHRPSGRGPSHVAGDRRGSGLRPWPERWAPSRCSLPTATTATKPPATTATKLAAGGDAAAEPSGQLRADDVHRHGRSRPARAAHASPVPRPAGA